VINTLVKCPKCEQPIQSDPPPTWNIVGQKFDPGLLDWLRIERHQLHHLKRHAHFDREAQCARFIGGQRVIMRPMSASKLSREGFRCSLLHSRRQQFHCSLLDLDERLLPHIGENQSNVGDALNGFQIAGFDEARGREPCHLRINRAEHGDSPRTISSAASAISVPPDMA